MLDDIEQKRLATHMGKLFTSMGIDVVFVGSTAVVGLDLYPRTSKDTDALGAPGLTLDEGRRVMREIATAEDLTYQEKGWGNVAAVRYDKDGNILWEVDLLVPGAGPIPVSAARRIHAKAVLTAIGRTAIAEHVLASKAIAWGDCMGKNDRVDARKYESDLFEFRNRNVVGASFSWREVTALLGEYEAARRRLAAGKIHEVFGRDVGLDQDADPSVA